MDLDQLVDENQSIKIVPSIEECLQRLGLNVELDDNTLQWYNQLTTSWLTWKKSTAMEQNIQIFFQSIPDPFRVVLVFLIKDKCFKDCKPKTLQYFLVEVLQKWSVSSGVAPEEKLKYPAFHIGIRQRNRLFLTLLMKTYNVCTIKEKILPIVREMIKNDNCKQASQIVLALELFDDIPIENLLFPLVLQEKTNMIDEYLCECRHQVEPFLQFLDGLLQTKNTLKSYVQNYMEDNKISSIKFNVHYKSLGKLVARLCNKFNVPIETCKNLSKNRTAGGLRYLIHQKYVEHNVSASVWDDLVKDSFKQNSESALEFIDMLVNYDRQEAIKWAKYLNIPQAELPLALKDYTVEIDTNNEEDWDIDSSNQDYYKLSLSKDRIILVDTAEKFYDCVLSNLDECNLIGLDCEWKPSFGATQSHVALIQVATSTNVYLIDTLILNKPEYLSFWCTFYKSVLENGEIIKLGFGLEQDLKELKSSVTGLSNLKTKGEGLLDLSLLWKALLNCGLSLPSNVDSGGNSLSSLVQSCFGLPLEKSEQCSNWEIRPLRSTQIDYAALDAYVLIEIYNYLQKLCMEQEMDFDEICNDVMLEKKKKTSAKKYKIIQKVDHTMNKYEMKLVTDIKFLVDPSLSHICQYLKYCGIDTLVMSATTLWHDNIHLAISEDRLVLLSKLKHTPTVNYPQSSILDVGKGCLKEQVKKVLFHFKIHVKETDLLSRCIICNSTEMRRLDVPEVESICKKYELAKSSCVQSSQYLYYSDNEDNMENFLSESDNDEDLYQPVTPVLQTVLCNTNKNVPIEINNFDSLYASPVNAVLCEDCGRLFWEGDELLRSVKDIVMQILSV